MEEDFFLNIFYSELAVYVLFMVIVNKQAPLKELFLSIQN